MRLKQWPEGPPALPPGGKIAAHPARSEHPLVFSLAKLARIGYFKPFNKMRPLNPSLLPAGARLPAFGRLYLLLMAVLCCPGISQAQGDIEIFLLTINLDGDSLGVGPAENLTQNPGYDNQPAFTADGALLFASTRNEQTDIARLDLASRTHAWLCDTPGGGEYSPLPIPGRESVSAIRLDTNGLQRLYAYQDGESRLLFPDLKVGYQVWAGPDLLICTVLRDEGMDLVRAVPNGLFTETLREGVGRSLARIPGSGKISYTTYDNGLFRVMALDLQTGAAIQIATLPEGVQDLCWLPDGSLLCGGDGVLRRLRPDRAPDWQVVHRFDSGFGQISRMAVNEAGTLLALVAEQVIKP